VCRDVPWCTRSVHASFPGAPDAAIMHACSTDGHAVRVPVLRNHHARTRHHRSIPAACRQAKRRSLGRARAGNSKVHAARCIYSPGTEATSAATATPFPRVSCPGAPSVTINAGTVLDSLVPCLPSSRSGLASGRSAGCLAFLSPCRLKTQLSPKQGKFVQKSVFFYLTVVQTSSLLPFE
jgi:hypothetical protein